MPRGQLPPSLHAQPPTRIKDQRAAARRALVQRQVELAAQGELGVFFRVAAPAHHDPRDGRDHRQQRPNTDDSPLPHLSVHSLSAPPIAANDGQRANPAPR